MNEVMVLTKVIGCTLATSNRRALVIVKVIDYYLLNIEKYAKSNGRPVLGRPKIENKAACVGVGGRGHCRSEFLGFSTHADSPTKRIVWVCLPSQTRGQIH